MPKGLTLSRARRILRVVPSKQSFWLCTNRDLRSLNSLANELEDSNDDVFRYHVNRYKNDFSNWVKDIIGDNDFAREISRIRTKPTLVRKIREKINESKDIVNKYKKVTKRVRKPKKKVKVRKAKSKAKKSKPKKPTKRRKLPVQKRRIKKKR
ncbi:MAG: hypothetical protein ABIG95_00185 [Candidatus Woesearchaeota archaeon]